MNSKTAMMIVGFFVMLVMALGHEGGPLTKMSEAGQGSSESDRSDAPSMAAVERETPKRVARSSGYREVSSSGISVDLENPESFAKKDEQGYDWDAFFSDDPDPQPMRGNKARQKRVRAAHFDRNPLPAGEIVYDFDPRLEWSEAL